MTKHDAQPASTFAWLGWFAAFGLIALVVVRCVAEFSPSLWWTIDPRAMDVNPDTGELLVTAFGPAGTAVTDLMMMGVLAIALLDAVIRRRRVRVGLLGLWAVGLGFAMWQGSRDAESLRLGATWAGSLAIALAAVHLADDPAIKRVLIAVLVALIVPLAMQAGYQYAVEHPMTVAQYMKGRDEFAAKRGWAPGSSQQRKYEERLVQREATGRFGLSNVFGSVAMTLTLVAAGAAAGLAWRRPRWREPAAYVAAGVAAVGLITLGLSFSKGATMAMAAAMGATLVVAVVTRWLPRPQVWWRLAAVGIVAAGIGGVIVRGQMGEPDSAAGERSLLFRWHYWQAAGRMMADEPIAGVGPGRFQQAYIAAKNPLNPEDVTDPHNVFVAYIATLGLGGWAWSAVLVGLVMGAGAAAGRADDGDDATDLPLRDASTGAFGERGRWWLVAGAGLIAFGAQLVVERPRHEAVSSLLWLAGLGVFIGLAGWLGGMRAMSGRVVRIGLFAAATGMLLHAQIEMSLTKAMSGPVLLAVLGVAAARREAGAAATEGRRRVAGLVRVAGVVGVAIAMAVVAVMAVGPIVGEERALERAAHMLRAGFGQAAMDRLLDARRAMMRRDASGRDVDTDPAVCEHEAMLLTEQAMAAHRANLTAERDLMLDAAMKATARARATGSQVASSWMTQTNIAERAFELTSDPGWLRAAFDAAVARTAVDPYGVESHLRAADLAFRIGRFADARRLYERALGLSERSYLDPNRQLDDAARAHIADRLRRMTPREPASPPPPRNPPAVPGG